MELKNILKVNNNIVQGSKYIPSSLEKKRAMMMYLFFGIMVSINKKNMSPFEYYHLKQASGWRILFFLSLVFGFVLLFIPIIKYIGILLLLILLITWIVSVKQSRDGKYCSVDEKKSSLFLFSLLGGWFIELFEISTTQTEKSKLDGLSDIEQDLTHTQTDSQTEIEKDLETK